MNSGGRSLLFAGGQDRQSRKKQYRNCSSTCGRKFHASLLSERVMTAQRNAENDPELLDTFSDATQNQSAKDSEKKF
jgi:hypothetical protein